MAVVIGLSNRAKRRDAMAKETTAIRAVKIVQETQMGLSPFDVKRGHVTTEKPSKMIQNRVNVLRLRSSPADIRS